MESLKIVAAQLKGTLDLDFNFNKHVEYIKNTDCDLLLFPECSLIGYDLENIFNYKRENSVIGKLETFHKELIEFIQNNTDKTVIFGSIIKDKNSNIFNCSFIVSKNFIKIYKKINLTEDEKSIFKPGKELVHFELKGKRVFTIICRDQSSLKIFYEFEKLKADLVLISAAHYYTVRDVLWKKYKNMAIPITRALDFGTYIVKANAVGLLNGDILSHGNSIAVSKEGKILGILDEFSESILEVTI